MKYKCLRKKYTLWLPTPTSNLRVIHHSLRLRKWGAKSVRILSKSLLWMSKGKNHIQCAQLHTQRGGLIPQTSVSTGSVSSNPPVKVSWTNILLMLTQLTPTSPIQAPMWRQSVGMTLDLKTNFLIVKNPMRNSLWIMLLQCIYTTLTLSVTTVFTAANISLAMMSCTQFTYSSAQHLAMAIQDAPADIKVWRYSLFLFCDSLWPYWCQSVATCSFFCLGNPMGCCRK